MASGGGGYDLSQSNASSSGSKDSIGFGATTFGSQNVGLSWQIVVAIAAAVAIAAYFIWGNKRG